MSPFKWHKRLEKNRLHDHESGRTANKIGPLAARYSEWLLKLEKMAREHEKNHPRRPWDIPE